MVRLSAGEDSPLRRLGVMVAFVTVLACYGQMTRSHLPVWRNGISLWTHAAEHVPQLAVVQIQLANSLKDEGRTEEAVAVLSHALQHCSPDAPDRQRILKKLSAWRN